MSKFIANNPYNTSISGLSYIKNGFNPQFSQQGRRGQHGITLVMVLVFMVTLSLLAAVGMRSVIVGERTVANELDRNLAFQAAESAGREAVGLITAGTHVTLTEGNYGTPFAFGGNIRHWQTTSDLTEANVCNTPAGQRFRWASTGTVCSAKATQKYLDTAKYPLAVEPRYVIERLPAVTSSTSGMTDCWYRITSRATGGSNQADVILQLMFANPVASPPSPPGALATCV